MMTLALFLRSMVTRLKTSLCLLVAVAVFFNASSLHASFDDLGAGARGPGMADAQVAVADDANAIYYNPAGLVQLGQGEISTQFGEMDKGLGDNSKIGNTYLSVAEPVRLGYNVFGMSYQNLKAEGLLSERTIALSMARRLDAEPFGWRGIWSTGFNLKQLHRQYESNLYTQNALNEGGLASNQHDPLFDSGYAKDAYSLDLGALYQFGRSYNTTIGAMIMNANQPDVSLRNDGDKAPMVQKLGIAYRPEWGLLTAEVRRANRLGNQSDSDFAFGVERNFRLEEYGALALRAGYATGSRNFKTITAGMSYYFSRFRLDYSFGLPIESLSGTQGSHRLGLTFRFGPTPLTTRTLTDYSNQDLLAAFAYDSLATHVVLTRLALDRNISLQERDLAMRLLIRKYALDDPGLANARAELRDVLKGELQRNDWARIEYAILKHMSFVDQPNAQAALEAVLKGDAPTAENRLALLSPTGKADTMLSALSIMVFAQNAAAAYRVHNYDRSLGYLWKMIQILPKDEVLLKAYRDLLAVRNKVSQGTEKMPAETLTAPEELPQAPATLVAPHSVTTGENVKPVLNEQEEWAKKFGMALGYYLDRKAAGASVEEMQSLLTQMKQSFEGHKLDTSLIDRELADLKDRMSAPAPVKPIQAKPTQAKPVQVKPVQGKPVGTKTGDKGAVKPAKVIPAPNTPTKVAPLENEPVNVKLERAWEYYHQAVDRNVSDHEKIEILENMKKEFGSVDALKIDRELQRIRRRLSE